MRGLIYGAAAVAALLYLLSLLVIARVAMCGPDDPAGPRLGGKFVIMGCP
jgi:hypothetical protein